MLHPLLLLKLLLLLLMPLRKWTRALSARLLGGVSIIANYYSTTSQQTDICIDKKEEGEKVGERVKEVGILTRIRGNGRGRNGWGLGVETIRCV